MRDDPNPRLADHTYEFLPGFPWRMSIADHLQRRRLAHWHALQGIPEAFGLQSSSRHFVHPHFKCLTALEKVRLPPTLGAFRMLCAYPEKLLDQAQTFTLPVSYVGHPAMLTHSAPVGSVTGILKKVNPRSNGFISPDHPIFPGIPKD
ncbi:hypothetical protein C8R44DRAFT_861049 [Mycena epipterygia]|nr:hypothetical protein C8R44DRAFT_861049 [Mycena epipterygia]